MRRFTSLVLLLCALGTAARAQLVLSQPASNNAGGPLNNGQSFVPGDAGTFPTSTAYLTQFTFVTSAQSSNNPNVPTYLSLYTNLNGTGYVGSSTNTQVWTNANQGATLTWSFGSLALTKTTTYFAFFSSSATSGNLITQPLAYTNTSAYPNGTLVNNGVTYSDLDAKFSATFATAVPEPSTYALLGGLSALAFVGMRRRVRRR